MLAIDALPIIDPVYSQPRSRLWSSERWRAKAGAGGRIGGCGASVHLWLVADGLGDQRKHPCRSTRAVEGQPGSRSRTCWPILKLFQPWFRRVVAETPDSVMVGYYSILAGGRIDWTNHPIQHDPLIDRVAATDEAGIFPVVRHGQVMVAGGRASRWCGGRGVRFRYGIMGGTEMGFWGIRTQVDRDGKIFGRPESFQQPRSVTEVQLE